MVAEARPFLSARRFDLGAEDETNKPWCCSSRATGRLPMNRVLAVEQRAPSPAPRRRGIRRLRLPGEERKFLYCTEIPLGPLGRISCS